MAAWDRCVEATATRHNETVRDWAMWGEPGINKVHRPQDVAAFDIRSAEIL